MVTIARTSDLQHSVSQQIAPVQWDPLVVRPGHITELRGVSGSGMTRIGLKAISPFSKTHPVAVVDTRGWISPIAAWETGIEEEHLVMIKCSDTTQWPRVVAALVEGVRAVYAEVPARVRESDLRRISALIRARRVATVMRTVGQGLPGGMSYVKLRSLGVTWEGADHGHGRLKRRRIHLEASGKGAMGMTRRFEIEDEGTNVMRLVSDVVVDPSGRTSR